MFLINCVFVFSVFLNIRLFTSHIETKIDILCFSQFHFLLYNKIYIFLDQSLNNLLKINLMPD